MSNPDINSNYSHSIDRFIIPGISIVLGIMICLRYAVYITIPLPVITALSLVIILLARIYRNTRYCIPLLIFQLYYGATLFIHPYSEPLLRFSRYVAFAIGILLFSPLLMSKQLTLARKYIFVTIFRTLLLMVLISFFIWIYCTIMGYEISDSHFYYYGFKGIFDSGMVLSPAAGVVAIISLHKSLTTTSSPRILWLTTTLISATTCVAAGSRIAVLGMITAFIVEFVLMRNEIKDIFSDFKYKIASIIVLLGLVAISPAAFKVINHKISIGQAHNSIIYSRQKLWTTRIDEIRTSPLIGIGYANESTALSSENATHKPTNIEPGSSWLSLVSYGGIIGLGIFGWFSYKMFSKISANRHKKYVIPTIALLTFFFVDGIAEGWLMFSGALLFPIFWQTCSAAFMAQSYQQYD